jgi:hypothetical protein
MDAATAVERALPLFSAIEPNEWKALRSALRKAGLPAELAADVAAFMPIAFGRALLDGMGVDFSDRYVAQDAGGRMSMGGTLADHPVYAAAAAHARRMIERQEGGDAFVGVAVWSTEFAAVNQALHAGSNPADLVVSPPILLRDEPEAADPGGARKPWWKVWG